LAENPVREEKTMRTKNKIDLIGFVGRDPETSTTTGGSPVTRFSVATNDRWKGKDGQLREHTEWHRIVFFGPQAAKVAEFVHKSTLVEVEGSVRSRTYEKDGITRLVYEVRGDEFRVLERRPTSEDGVGPFGLDAPADDVPPDDELPI
jgi:single-strand DNA-binding protein